MKETIEQAAKEYADGLRSVDKKSTYDNIEVDSARMVAFKRGAEWQAKQSPWIKTSEKLPTPTIEIVDDEEYGSVFVVGRTSKWKTPQLCCYYGCNGNYRWEDGIVPEYWMPIPE